MIDQMFLILAEVLSTDVLDRPQLSIVLVVDVVVTTVDLLSDVLDVVAQRLNFLVKFLVEGILEGFDGLCQV